MESSKKGIDRYSTFGLRDEWLPMIFTHEERWYERNNLGPVQVKAVRSWLADAGLIVKKGTTPLFRRIRELYFLEPVAAWQILWVNLYHGSPIVKLFCDHVGFDEYLDKNGVVEAIRTDLGDLKDSTLKNPVTALINMFEKSRLGTIVSMRKIRNTPIKRIRLDDLDQHVVAYALYRLAEEIDTREIEVEYLYGDDCPGGPFRLFGISEESLTVKLQESPSMTLTDGVIHLDGRSSTKLLDEYISSLRAYSIEGPDLDSDDARFRDKLNESILRQPEKLLGERRNDLEGFLRGFSLRELRIRYASTVNPEVSYDDLHDSGPDIQVALILRIHDGMPPATIEGPDNVLMVSPDASLTAETYELLLDHMTLALRAGDSEHSEVAGRIISAWLGDMMDSGFQWYLNGESGRGDKFYGLSELISSRLSRMIFPFGPENLPEIRGNRNLWNPGKDYPKVFEIFFLSEDLEEFKRKTGSGLYRFIAYILRGPRGDWIVDENLNLLPEVYHPVKTMADVTVEKFSKGDFDPVAEMKFLSRPPYGLKGDMIGHAVVSFILRTLRGHMVKNGRLLEDDEFRILKQKIIEGWK
ncbi:hypothetical protein [Methanothermobacter thermautotrophicus]|jgi:hypothetical protein|uniref:DUF4007 family protein n=1 Tax=Methanothermobacter thermautotrophicus TaxID=145262 RepID=A0A7J4MXX8_METTF|nr:hypothetical protein [Methanothermobacter sp.]HIH65495.1 DUF4007 family protein [Methanothermobacter thermautotrophicus]